MLMRDSKFKRSSSSSYIIGCNRTKNNNLLSRQQTIAQIQPHQGRNPCLERNVNAEEVDEDDNDLITGSMKDKQPLINKKAVPAAVSAARRSALVERRIPRISYVQNNLGAESPRKNVNADVKA